jgi:ABC-type phosphate/phosphonate transport system permease subunit
LPQNAQYLPWLLSRLRPLDNTTLIANVCTGVYARHGKYFDQLSTAIASALFGVFLSVVFSFLSASLSTSMGSAAVDLSLSAVAMVQPNDFVCLFVELQRKVTTSKEVQFHFLV